MLGNLLDPTSTQLTVMSLRKIKTLLIKFCATISILTPGFEQLSYVSLIVSSYLRLRLISLSLCMWLLYKRRRKLYLLSGGRIDEQVC